MLISHRWDSKSKYEADLKINKHLKSLRYLPYSYAP